MSGCFTQEVSSYKIETNENRHQYSLKSVNVLNLIPCRIVARIMPHLSVHYCKLQLISHDLSSSAYSIERLS